MAINQQYLLDQLRLTVVEIWNALELRMVALNDRELLLPREDGGWSIAQIMEHLNVYARYYQPLLRTKMENNGHRVDARGITFRSGWLGNYFTNLMKPTAEDDLKKGKKKKKMKAPSFSAPPRDLPAQQVLQEYRAHIKDMLFLLDAAGMVDLNKFRIPISIAPFIRLKGGDVLQFLVAHLQRHHQQMEGVYIQIKAKELVGEL